MNKYKTKWYFKMVKCWREDFVYFNWILIYPACLTIIEKENKKTYYVSWFLSNKDNYLLYLDYFWLSNKNKSDVIDYLYENISSCLSHNWSVVYLRLSKNSTERTLSKKELDKLVERFYL